MADEDLEKWATHSSTQHPSAVNRQTSGEKPAELFPPLSHIETGRLTSVSSRKSRQLSVLTPSRSFVDGHGTYHSRWELTKGKAEDDDHVAGTVSEVSWDGLDDPMNPKNMSVARKWLVVVILAFGSTCVSCTSSLYTTVYEKMDQDFGSSRIEATLGLSLFVFGLGVSPMLLGPLSEFYGRRLIYILAYVFFTIWLIPCAVARNIQTMLIARFLGGFSGSAFLSVAGGTVGDMFTRDQLQAPMMIYTASPFLGPGIGPVIGGFINYYASSWRWSFYVLLIWSGTMLVAVTLLVPETYTPVLLRRKAEKKRKETGDDRFKAPIEIHEKSIFWTVVRSLYRPFLLLTLDPMCFNLCLFSAILLGILYLFFGAFDLVFTDVYGFNLWQVGLTFLGLTTGMVIAIFSDPIWHWNYLRLIKSHNAKIKKLKQADSENDQSGDQEIDTGSMQSEPEFRLPPAIVGGWFATAGLFMFAWTIYPFIHWIVPLIGAALFGIGIILVFSGIFTFLVEAFPLYAASALSANSFTRSMFAGAFPLFGLQMYKTLNYHWATTLLAFLTLACSPFPYLFFIYGKRLRERSRFGSAT